jgi:hypothetical protein
MATPSQDLKRKCTDCGKRKPLDQFYARSWRPKSGETRLYTQCKACYKKRTHAYYFSPKHEEIKRKGNEYATQHRALVKDTVFARYGGYRCACCGETERSFLTLDHISNDGAEFRKKVLGSQTAAGYRTYRWLWSHGFPDGFQVLCANCQHGKRMNNGICPHQVRSNDYPAREYGQAAGSAAHPKSKLG